MTSRSNLIYASFAFAFGLAACSPAMALSMKDCSTKYEAAKSAGTLNGMKWNDFRKAECAAETPAAATTAPTTTKTAAAPTKPEAGTGLSMKACSTKYQAAKSGGTLNGMTWNEFRKADCGAGEGSTAATMAPTTTKTAATPAKHEAEAGLSMKDCSTKYQAAKSAGSLNGTTWNEFRKAECSAGASTAEAAGSGSAHKSSMSPMMPGNAVFPRAVAPKYASELAGRARLHTCVDQYNANKAANTNGNGGLRWIQKGGGYWSECDKRLKS